MTVTRWRLESLDGQESYEFAINPNDQSSPIPTRDIQWSWTRAGFTGLRAGRGPHRWEFSGVLRSKAQFDAFKYWVGRKEKVRLTDDLGRGYLLRLMSFKPRQEGGYRGANVPWRHEYSMECLVFEAEGKVLVEWESMWKYLARDQQALTGANETPVEFPLAGDSAMVTVAYNDSTWLTSQAAFGWDGSPEGYNGATPRRTVLPVKSEVWMRKTVQCTRNLRVSVRLDNFAYLYVNGRLVTGSYLIGRDARTEVEKGPFPIPETWLNANGEQVIALHVQDKLAAFGTGDIFVADVRVTGVYEPTEIGA